MDAAEPPADHDEDTGVDADLPDDGYAPARAYAPDPAARAYASDSGDGESDPTSTSTTTTSKTTGRSPVKEPLWPEQNKPASKPSPRGRPGRRQQSK
jgi:hypothetical protein